MAQVEENRRKKQQEEEQRKKEEQEEEQRLAREREEMQRQYEEDILKQKQKEVGTCIMKVRKRLEVCTCFELYSYMWKHYS